MAKIDYLVEIPLENYYGNVDVIELDGEYYMTLADWECTRAIQVSKELAELMEKELKGKTSKDVYVIDYNTENGTKIRK